MGKTYKFCNEYEADCGEYGKITVSAQSHAKLKMIKKSGIWDKNKLTKTDNQPKKRDRVCDGCIYDKVCKNQWQCEKFTLWFAKKWKWIKNGLCVHNGGNDEGIHTKA